MQIDQNHSGQSSIQPGSLTKSRGYLAIRSACKWRRPTNQKFRSATAAPGSRAPSCCGPAWSCAIAPPATSSPWPFGAPSSSARLTFNFPTNLRETHVQKVSQILGCPIGDRFRNHTLFPMFCEGKRFLQFSLEFVWPFLHFKYFKRCRRAFLKD